MYSSVFVLLIVLIAIGYRTPQEVSGGVANAVPGIASEVAAPVKNPTAVNQVVATSIAASVARAADIPIAAHIAERAVSIKIESQYPTGSDLSTISKPTIVQLSSASRNISSYVVQAGDTVQSVAAAYEVSPETIKWANNLTADTLVVGTTLEILPRSGIAYTVREGDTIQKIADKYKADVSSITTYNDLEISGVSTGLKIIIPSGELPTNERPGYVAPVSYSTGFVSGYGAWSGQVLNMYTFRGVDANSGGYAPGNCTAYAYYRRAQMGMPVPSNLGNAYTWATAARATGHYVVDKNPSVGAVIQSGNHVGVVEEVYPNGDLRITDMNYGYRVYNLAERIIPASTVGNYMFIH